MNKTIPAEVKAKSKITKEEWKEYTKTVWSIANVSHPAHPAVFPEEIPRRLIKLFSYWGETVLDPFGGIGTTAAVAASLGRGAVSVDQSEEYVRIARERCHDLFSANGQHRLEVVHGDAKHLSGLGDQSVSLIITSPPYWDKADYGDDDTNVGRRDSYAAFLGKMRDAFQECYRVLEAGRKFCIITANVNQYTEHGLLTFPIASDFAMILRHLGFVMINELIWSKDKTGGRWGSANSQRPIFGSYPYPPNFLFKNVHEYVLVFAKPNGEEKTGEKVRRYGDLMGWQSHVTNNRDKTRSSSDKSPPGRARGIVCKGQ